MGYAVSPPIERITTPAGDPAWRVTGHALVKALLADQRLGLTHPKPSSASWYTRDDLAGRPMGGSGSEYEEHTWWRRAMNKVFSPQRLESLAPRVREIAEELAKGLATRTPPVDLRAEFTMPLCSRVICELLDIPEDHLDQLRHWTEEGAYAGDIERSLAGIRALMTYVIKTMRQRGGAPGDDPVSELLGTDIRRAKLFEGRVAKLVAGMLGFGRETPASALDSATVLLLTNPEQRTLLRADPDLVGGAVEETLRLFRPPAASQGGLLRYAHVDIALDDGDIGAGDMVLLDVVAANHDPAVFADPDRFDITRRPNPHLGFGHGFYMCNFTTLARIELRTGISVLFDHFPDCALAGTLTTRTHLRTGGLTALPVAW